MRKEAGFDDLTRALRKLTSLKHLSLSFSKSPERWNSCTTLTDAGLDSLRKGLQTLRNLQHLTLSFEEYVHLIGL